MTSCRPARPVVFLGVFCLFAAVPAKSADAPAAKKAADFSAEGAVVFQANCARCHGEAADGNSRLSEVLHPPPANLQRSRLTRQEQENMIRTGGLANGRSAVMPAWQDQISNRDIGRLLDFLARIRTK